MNDVTATTEAAAAKTAPKAKKAAAKTAAKKAAAERATKVSAARKKPAKKAAAPKEDTLLGLPLTTKLAYGKDADGKAYSAKNSPKRDGSASAKRWAKYAIPGTIQKQIDAGATRDDLRWDISHKLLVKA